MSIEKNVEIRKAAELAIELAECAIQEAIRDSPEWDSDDTAAVWALFKKRIDANDQAEPKPVTADSGAMDHDEALRFERFAMTFGKHQGQKVRDVPLDYLTWLDEQNDFAFDLRRYLRSRTVWEQQEVVDE